MSRQQQHQPSRYGHSHSHSHSHSHPFGPAHTHPHHHHDADPDNQGGTGGYADIDDEMAMLGYHHSGGPSPLDDYHYPDRPVAPDTSLAPGQYQQRLIYLQQHQHQHQHQQRAAAAAAQAHAAASTFGPPSEHAEPNGWHGRAHLHLHHHHPPGYGRHLHAHAAAAAARYAPYPPQAGAPAAAAAAAARRSVTGSPVLAKDQHQLQMNVLKSPTADMMAAIGADTRSHRSGSQRSGHLTHRSPSTSSLPAASAAAPAPARTHPSHVHKHHALPPRPRVHHPSDAYDGLAAKSAPAPTSTTPNQSPVIPRPLDPISLSSPSDSNGYRPSGSNGNSSSSDNSSSRLARTARATRAAESRSTAAHEGSATSTDDSSSSDPTRVPASTTSSSGSSSTNTKTQSATSSAPESVPEPPPVPPVPPPQQQQQQQQPQPQVVVPEKRTRAAKQGAAEQAQSANKQTVPPPASLQLTKDRAWAQSVIEHVSDMVLSLAPNGTIVWASPSARKVVGFNAAELAGRHLGEFVHPEDAQLLTRTLTASIAQSTASPATNGTPTSATSAPRDSSFDVMVRFRRKNADYFLIHVTGRALLVSNAANTPTDPADFPDLVTSPTSAAFPTAATQPLAPPMGVPVAPGIGLHPFSLPYNPGNLMAAAAALATASPLHTFPTATPAPARPPPLLVAICREYPLGDHATQLDEVVGLRFENELLREKLAAGYAKRGASPPAESALSRGVGTSVPVKLTEVVLPTANGVATQGPMVSVPGSAGEGSVGAASVGKKGLSAAIVPSDILRVAVERGVMQRARGGAAGADEAAAEGDVDDSEWGGPGKARGKGKKKRKLNGIKPSDERVCIDCGVTSSSEWRKGPMGAKTLCNACGLRYAKRKKDEAAARARAMADQASSSASLDSIALDAASAATTSTSLHTAPMSAEASSSSLSAASSSAAPQPPPASGSHSDQAMDTDGGKLR